MDARPYGSCVIRDGGLDWLPAALLEHADAYGSRSESDADRTSRRELFDARWLRARSVLRAAGIGGVAGVCPLCEVPRHFVSHDLASDQPDLREGLVCDGCGTNARTRAGLLVLRTLCPDRMAAVYLTEQVSTAWLWLCKRYPAGVGSEFERSRWRRIMLSCRLWLMGWLGNVRFEDVTRLTLADASQQAVLSFDVLEHVPDYRAALRDFARVTAADGWLILTAPFTGAEHSLERARMQVDGGIVHLHPAEYHGDPLGDDLLCFHHFGWDLLDDLRTAGYRNAAVVFPWWPEAGLFHGLATIVAKR